MQNTIVHYHGEQNLSRCGYCRNMNSSNSHGMHAYFMSPQDYQDLIDRGWRRSGQYCYKPNNRTTCCPSYTIRCNVQEFRLSKSQKKVLKRMNKFLQNGIKDKGENSGSSVAVAGSSVDFQRHDANVLAKEEPDIPDMALKDIEISVLTNKSPDEAAAAPTSCNEPNILPSPIAEKRRDDATSTDSRKSTRPPCKKAKQMRLERREAKLVAQGNPPETANNPKSSIKASQEKTLKEYIEDVPENARHKLTVVIVPSNKGVTKPVLDLYRKYQFFVHKESPQKNTQKSFERFLVRSPLQLTKTADGPEEGYGSFHQQYWLDDRLIAVGVIDILPYCVSSVYFFYDPEYNFLSLGTYGSLREVYLTNKLSERSHSLKYYYMGFYIHSCPKMIYKGRLSPSYLLCPEVYTWHLLTDEVRKELDETKYRRLNTFPDAEDSNCFREDDLDPVLIMCDRNSFVTYKNYVEAADETRMLILEYGQLVGRSCAHRMLYVNF